MPTPGLPKGSTTPMAYDLFISYARRDDDPDGRITQFVERVGRDFAALAGRELRPFFDRSPVASIESWRERILPGLRESRLLLACLTPSYHASESCAWELIE